jgi:hypothetical protein
MDIWAQSRSEREDWENIFFVLRWIEHRPSSPLPIAVLTELSRFVFYDISLLYILLLLLLLLLPPLPVSWSLLCWGTVYSYADYNKIVAVENVFLMTAGNPCIWNLVWWKIILLFSNSIYLFVDLESSSSLTSRNSDVMKSFILWEPEILHSEVIFLHETETNCHCIR